MVRGLGGLDLQVAFEIELAGEIVVAAFVERLLDQPERDGRRLMRGAPSSACASGISRSSSTTRQIMPHSAAVSAGSGSASIISARARAVPTRRGRNQVPPQSGTRPIRAKACTKLAERAAITMSQASARLAPGAGRDAVDRGDDRQRQFPDFFDHRMVAVEQIGDVVRVGVDDRGQVLAGAKAAPGAGQQHRAAGFVGLCVVERGDHRIGHLRRQRIEPVRPVQRDPAIEGKGVDEDHEFTPPRSSRRWSNPAAPRVRHDARNDTPFPRRAARLDRVAGAIPKCRRSRNGETVGRVAQRESTVFTRQGSLVQSQPRPPYFSVV